MSRLDEADLRRALAEITKTLEEQRDRAAEDAKRAPSLDAFYEGMELQARVALAVVHGWTRGEFGAVHTAQTDGDSAVTS